VPKLMAEKPNAHRLGWAPVNAPPDRRRGRERTLGAGTGPRDREAGAIGAEPGGLRLDDARLAEHDNGLHGCPKRGDRTRGTTPGSRISPADGGEVPAIVDVAEVGEREDTRATDRCFRTPWDSGGLPAVAPARRNRDSRIHRGGVRGAKAFSGGPPGGPPARVADVAEGAQVRAT
jgi:hypothetical protein